MFFFLNFLWNLFFVIELLKVWFLFLNFENVYFYSWISSLHFFINWRNSYVKMNFFKVQGRKTNFSKFIDEKQNSYIVLKQKQYFGQFFIYMDIRFQILFNYFSCHIFSCLGFVFVIVLALMGKFLTEQGPPRKVSHVSLRWQKISNLDD